MNKKVYDKIMSGKCDHSIRFKELQNLLTQLGLSLQRIQGSHHIYAYPGIAELIDLQTDKKDHSKAKSYQVKQVRNFIKLYLEVK